MFLKESRLRWFKAINNIINLAHRSYEEIESLSFFNRKGKYVSGSKRPVVLVECVEDPYYMNLFGVIAHALFQERQTCVEYVQYRCLNVGESFKLVNFFVARCLINPVLNKKWRDIYNEIGLKLGFSLNTFNFFSDSIALINAFFIWRRIRIKRDLIELHLDNIRVGDLINDSYLRFKPAPTVNLHDAYLWLLIWQTKRAISQSRRYFRKKRPSMFLVSYSSYIQHGITTRVALAEGVSVFAFGNYQEFMKQLTVEDYFHTRNAYKYASDFALFPVERQTQAMSQGHAALKSRIAGKTDVATSYMVQSPYKVVTNEVPNVSGSIVIFLQDFYDSPHVYPNELFPDCWEWICFTIESLVRLGYKFYVKPHPNQIDLSSQVLQDLTAKYPHLQFISPLITNKQLSDAGLAAGITVHGTVAHELAFLGIPSVGCADHPHISFDFCQTAKTLEQYESLLKNCISFVVDKSNLVKQSTQFYFMHNLNNTPEESALLNGLQELRDMQKDPYTFCNVESVLRNIESLCAFKQHVSRLLQFCSR
jgi:hypothetical protein